MNYVHNYNYTTNFEVNVSLHSEGGLNYVHIGDDQKKEGVLIPTPSPPLTHESKEGDIKKNLLILNYKKT